MKLTCVSSGDPSTPDVTTTFLLQFRGLRILLESPLCLDVLRRFAPSYYPKLSSPGPSFHEWNFDCPSLLESGWMPCTGSRITETSTSSSMKLLPAEGQHQSCGSSGDVLPEVAAIPLEMEAECQEVPASKHNPDLGFAKSGEEVLMFAEPMYLVPELGMVDLGSVDVILISNPASMLSLPYLTKSKQCSAKIFATDVAAQIGHLMMSELVTFHDEHQQLYDDHPSNSLASAEHTSWQVSSEAVLPKWLQRETGSCIDPFIKTGLIGHDGSAALRWHCLYSQEDIRHCMACISRLHYGEIVDINGRVQISPHPSGSCLGSSNWMIRGSGKEIAYVAASFWGASPAMPLASAALSGADVMIIADIAVEKKLASLKGNPPGDNGNAVTAAYPEITSMMETAACGRMRLADISNKLDRKLIAELLTGAYGWPGLVEPQEVLLPLTVACRAAVRTVGRGGCALIPVGVCGEELQMFEVIAAKLNRLGYGHVQIFYISPIAEEALAYSNIIPEWVSPARQEKLDIPEASFGHHQLLQDKRLQHFSSLYSPELRLAWQEPCVVFAAHPSLRMGAAVDLIFRWRHDRRCTLILTEPSLDVDAVLEPFQPMEMQTFYMPLNSKLRLHDVFALADQTKPKKLLLPDDALKTLEDCGALRALPAMQVQSYKGRQTIKMHQPSPLVSLEMSSELTGTIQMHPVSGSTGIAAARMSAVMSVANGKLQLLQRPDASMWPGASGARGGRIAELSDLHANNWRLFQTEKQKRWICGSIDANKLIVSLGQKGFTDVQVVVNRRPRGGRERKRQGEADLDSSLDNESKKRKILPEAAGQDLRPDRKEGEVEERVMMEGCFRRDRSHQQNSGERVQVSSAIGDKGNLLMTNEICGTFTTAVAGGEDTIEVDLMERDREVREFTDLSPVVGRSNEKDGEGEPQHYTRIGNEKSVAQEGDGKSASEKEEGEIEEMTDDAANDIEEDATNRIVQGIEVVGEEDTVLIAVKSATTKTTIKISKNETHIHASHPLHRQMLLEAVIAELCVL